MESKDEEHNAGVIEEDKSEDPLSTMEVNLAEQEPIITNRGLVDVNATTFVQDDGLPSSSGNGTSLTVVTAQTVECDILSQTLSTDIEEEQVEHTTEGTDRFVVNQFSGSVIHPPKKMSLADYKKRRSTVEELVSQIVSGQKLEIRNDDTVQSHEMDKDIFSQATTTLASPVIKLTNVGSSEENESQMTPQDTDSMKTDVMNTVSLKTTLDEDEIEPMEVESLGHTQEALSTAGNGVEPVGQTQDSISSAGNDVKSQDVLPIAGNDAGVQNTENVVIKVKKCAANDKESSVTVPVSDAEMLLTVHDKCGENSSSIDASDSSQVAKDPPVKELNMPDDSLHITSITKSRISQTQVDSVDEVNVVKLVSVSDLPINRKVDGCKNVQGVNILTVRKSSLSTNNKQEIDCLIPDAEAPMMQQSEAENALDTGEFEKEEVHQKEEEVHQKEKQAHQREKQPHQIQEVHPKENAVPPHNEPKDGQEGTKTSPEPCEGESESSDVLKADNVSAVNPEKGNQQVVPPMTACSTRSSTSVTGDQRYPSNNQGSTVGVRHLAAPVGERGAAAVSPLGSVGFGSMPHHMPNPFPPHTLLPGVRHPMFNLPNLPHLNWLPPPALPIPPRLGNLFRPPESVAANMFRASALCLPPQHRPWQGYGMGFPNPIPPRHQFIEHVAKDFHMQAQPSPSVVSLQPANMPPIVPLSSESLIASRSRSRSRNRSGSPVCRSTRSSSSDESVSDQQSIPQRKVLIKKLSNCKRLLEDLQNVEALSNFTRLMDDLKRDDVPSAQSSCPDMGVQASPVMISSKVQVGCGFKLWSRASQTQTDNFYGDGSFMLNVAPNVSSEHKQENVSEPLIPNTSAPVRDSDSSCDTSSEDEFDAADKAEHMNVLDNPKWGNVRYVWKGFLKDILCDKHKNPEGVVHTEMSNRRGSSSSSSSRSSEESMSDSDQSSMFRPSPVSGCSFISEGDLVDNQNHSPLESKNCDECNDGDQVFPHTGIPGATFQSSLLPTPLTSVSSVTPTFSMSSTSESSLIQDGSHKSQCEDISPPVVSYVSTSSSPSTTIHLSTSFTTAQITGSQHVNFSQVLSQSFLTHCTPPLKSPPLRSSPVTACPPQMWTSSPSMSKHTTLTFVSCPPPVQAEVATAVDQEHNAVSTSVTPPLSPPPNSSSSSLPHIRKRDKQMPHYMKARIKPQVLIPPLSPHVPAHHTLVPHPLSTPECPGTLPPPSSTVVSETAKDSPLHCYEGPSLLALDEKRVIASKRHNEIRRSTGAQFTSQKIISKNGSPGVKLTKLVEAKSDVSNCNPETEKRSFHGTASSNSAFKCDTATISVTKTERSKHSLRSSKLIRDSVYHVLERDNVDSKRDNNVTLKSSTEKKEVEVYLRKYQRSRSNEKEKRQPNEKGRRREIDFGKGGRHHSVSQTTEDSLSHTTDDSPSHTTGDSWSYHRSNSRSFSSLSSNLNSRSKLRSYSGSHWKSHFRFYSISNSKCHFRAHSLFNGRQRFKTRYVGHHRRSLNGLANRSLPERRLQSVSKSRSSSSLRMFLPKAKATTSEKTTKLSAYNPDKSRSPITSKLSQPLSNSNSLPKVSPSQSKCRLSSPEVPVQKKCTVTAADLLVMKGSRKNAKKLAVCNKSTAPSYMKTCLEENAQVEKSGVANYASLANEKSSLGVQYHLKDTSKGGESPDCSVSDNLQVMENFKKNLGIKSKRDTRSSSPPSTDGKKLMPRYSSAGHQLGLNDLTPNLPSSSIFPAVAPRCLSSALPSSPVLPSWPTPSSPVPMILSTPSPPVPFICTRLEPALSPLRPCWEPYPEPEKSQPLYLIEAPSSNNKSEHSSDEKSSVVKEVSALHTNAIPFTPTSSKYPQVEKDNATANVASVSSIEPMPVVKNFVQHSQNFCKQESKPQEESLVVSYLRNTITLSRNSVPSAAASHQDPPCLMGTCSLLVDNDKNDTSVGMVSPVPALSKSVDRHIGIDPFPPVISLSTSPVFQPSTATVLPKNISNSETSPDEKCEETRSTHGMTKGYTSPQKRDSSIDDGFVCQSKQPASLPKKQLSSLIKSSVKGNQHDHDKSNHSTSGAEEKSTNKGVTLLIKKLSVSAIRPVKNSIDEKDDVMVSMSDHPKRDNKSDCSTPGAFERSTDKKKLIITERSSKEAAGRSIESYSDGKKNPSNISSNVSGIVPLVSSSDNKLTSQVGNNSYLPRPVALKSNKTTTRILPPKGSDAKAVIAKDPSLYPSKQIQSSCNEDVGNIKIDCNSHEVTGSNAVKKDYSILKYEVSSACEPVRSNKGRSGGNWKAVCFPAVTKANGSVSVIPVLNSQAMPTPKPLFPLYSGKGNKTNTNDVSFPEVTEGSGCATSTPILSRSEVLPKPIPLFPDRSSEGWKSNRRVNISFPEVTKGSSNVMSTPVVSNRRRGLSPVSYLPPKHFYGRITGDQMDYKVPVPVEQGRIHFCSPGAEYRDQQHQSQVEKYDKNFFYYNHHSAWSSSNSRIEQPFFVPPCQHLLQQHHDFSPPPQCRPKHCDTYYDNEDRYKSNGRYYPDSPPPQCQRISFDSAARFQGPCLDRYNLPFERPNFYYKRFPPDIDCPSQRWH